MKISFSQYGCLNFVIKAFKTFITFKGCLCHIQKSYEVDSDDTIVVNCAEKNFTSKKLKEFTAKIQNDSSEVLKLLVKVMYLLA